MQQFVTVATAEVTVVVPQETVWNALTGPDMTQQYMLGARVYSQWRVGSPITYRGTWHGAGYEDLGTILAIEPGRMLKATHYSPVSGLPDAPENCHTVTYALAGDGGSTTLTVSQEGNRDEGDVDASRRMWQRVLSGLKALLEGGAGDQ